MKSVQPDMNVARQRRKITHRIEHAPSPAHAAYLTDVLARFDASLAVGLPRPASEFLPAYAEEFDLEGDG
ncbi:hypothetical protein SEA_VINCENZO_80 [Mycobacterium phage Vincenzo]|uniref:Uncharacterized protein n=2 Tax=Coopervirus vincenzo TaxID=1983110 RepID=A0A0F6SJJ8_9CAUD|nr:hypothetical protein SEA_VINCENZO_80 [Mycobacterium phage Vincenzo]AKF14342.1 hypothetical protein SEA_VINCENZO_80 [Mycobacterium phage Vincenzo]AKF14746.1 hypothetical protein SEA_ALANGRANT_81 [Mycobacterium phage AlanGrant]